MKLDEILSKQQGYFKSGATLPVGFRVAMLKKLLAAVNQHEEEIRNALAFGLRKSDYEGFMCEIGLVRSEISHRIRHVRHYARERTVPTPPLAWHTEGSIDALFPGSPVFPAS